MIEYFLGVLNGLGGSWSFTSTVCGVLEQWEFREADGWGVVLVVRAGGKFEIWDKCGTGRYFDIKDHDSVVGAFLYILDRLGVT